MIPEAPERQQLLALGVPAHALEQAAAAGLSFAWLNWLRTKASVVFNAAVALGPSGWALAYRIQQAAAGGDIAAVLTAAAELFTLLQAAPASAQAPAPSAAP